MAEQWFYRLFGEEFGPVPVSSVREMIADGTIAADDEVRAGVDGSWIRANQLAESTLAGHPQEITDLSELTLVDERSIPAPEPVRSESPSSSGDAAASVPAQSCSPEQPVAPPPAASRPLESVAPSAPPSASQQDHGWFCQIDDQEFGPVDIETLVQWAADNRISPEHYVKMGQAGEWFQAGVVPGLIPEVEEQPTVSRFETAAPNAEQEDDARGADPKTIGSAGAGGAGTSTSAAELLQGIERRTMRAAAGLTEEPTEAESPPPSGSARGGGSSHSAKRSVRKRSANTIAGAESLQGKKVAIGILAVGLLALLFMYGPGFGSGSEKAHCDELTEIYTEFKGLRDAQASDGEFDAFAARVQQQIKPMIADLAKTAGAREPAKQALLYAARDYLMDVIQEGRTDRNTEDEKTFSQHLGRARRLINE
ncbi:MAG: hypothetical protein CMJ48_12280 [Planctomycetaceae bacterium]|nr:hypothetical protein [Planctomycetaceae bacterium]